MRTLMLMLILPSIEASNKMLIDETFSLATGEQTEDEAGMAVVVGRLNDSLATITDPASKYPDLAAWAADFWANVDTSELPPFAAKFVATVQQQVAAHLRVCKGHNLTAAEVEMVAPMINHLRAIWANMIEQIATTTPADADAFIATLAAAKIMEVSE